MVVFPNAKINIGLNILSKRDDGYHNIESCFYPIGFSDVLEILPSDKLTFTSTGIPIPGKLKSNLCLKAYELIKKNFEIPPVRIHLHKIIPIGAGLGGGSSDATFTLKVLNKIFELDISDHKLEQYAAQLGSDCPFFVRNSPVIATGTGTTFKSCKIDLSGYFLALAFPGIHIGTQEAYAGIKPTKAENPIPEIIAKTPHTWKDLLINDFEHSIFPNHSEIEVIKDTFYETGAIYSSMTGSGSAVYGLFEKETPVLPNVVWRQPL